MKFILKYKYFFLFAAIVIVVIFILKKRKQSKTSELTAQPGTTSTAAGNYYPAGNIGSGANSTEKMPLSKGMQGPVTLWLQQKLNMIKGAGLQEDSNFGQATENAVYKYYNVKKVDYNLLNRIYNEN